jgi:phosphate transport system substrate-binding protein
MRKLVRSLGMLLVMAIATWMAAAPAVRAQDVEPPANADQLKELSGDILIDGSSTVYPVTQAAAEQFMQYAPNVRITVGISGTGGGFKKISAHLA